MKLLARFREWCARRKREKQLVLRARGFDYAWDALSCGKPPEELLAEADSFDRNSFDEGIEAAVTVWENWKVNHG